MRGDGIDVWRRVHIVLLSSDLSAKRTIPMKHPHITRDFAHPKSASSILARRTRNGLFQHWLTKQVRQIQAELATASDEARIA
jgi:hypothetical protein